MDDFEVEFGKKKFCVEFGSDEYVEIHPGLFQVYFGNYDETKVSLLKGILQNYAGTLGDIKKVNALYAEGFGLASLYADLSGAGVLSASIYANSVISGNISRILKLSATSLSVATAIGAMTKVYCMNGNFAAIANANAELFAGKVREYSPAFSQAFK